MKTFSIPGSWELTQTLHLLVIYFQVLQNSWNYGSKCPKSRKSQLLNTKSPGVICVLPGFLVWCFAMTNTVMAAIIFHVCCDESKRRLFWSDQCRKCKSSVWNILWCLKNEFSFQILYEVIARILFSACWNLLWSIKTNLVFRWQMQYSCNHCI